MSRNTPVFTTERSARITSAAQDEVELTYPFEGMPSHQDNGKKLHAYYSVEQYAARQNKHGLAFYPEPTPFKP